MKKNCFNDIKEILMGQTKCFSYLSLLMLIICTILTARLSGQSRIFNGNFGKYWDTGNNWTPLGTPNSADSVFLVGDTVEIPAGFNARALHVDIADTTVLVIQRDLSVFLIGRLTLRATPATAIYNRGILYNRGRVLIEDCGGYGINNEGIICNDSLARILIDSTLFFGIFNKDSIANSGLIEIKSLFSGSIYGINNSGQIRNAGKIMLDSLPITGILTGGDEALFVNMDTLIISHFNLLELPGNAAIANNGGVFINSENGFIDINSGSLVGAGLSNRASFTNEGEIYIHDIESYGILQITDGALLQNLGSIIIDDVILAGIAVSDSSSFQQFSNGSISISNVLGDGLDVERDAEFDIDGILEIQ